MSLRKENIVLHNQLISMSKGEIPPDFDKLPTLFVTDTVDNLIVDLTLDNKEKLIVKTMITMPHLPIEAIAEHAGVEVKDVEKFLKRIKRTKRFTCGDKTFYLSKITVANRELFKLIDSHFVKFYAEPAEVAD